MFCKNVILFALKQQFDSATESLMGFLKVVPFRMIYYDTSIMSKEYMFGLKNGS
jgi:hypothetical protein